MSVIYSSPSSVQPKKQWYVPIWGVKLAEINLLAFQVL